MKKVTIAILILLLFSIIGNYTYSVYGNRYEFRSDFLEVLLHGSLSLWIITVLLLIIVIWLIEIKVRKVNNKYFPMLLLVGILFTLVFIVSVFWTVIDYERQFIDVGVYKNINNENEKLVFQSHRDDFTYRNSYWRVVKIENEGFLIRQIKIVAEQSPLCNTYFDSVFNLSPIVKHLEYDRKNYELDCYLDIDANNKITKKRNNAR
ncbi:hypothetical protein [Alistipes sp. ZOR0009]|uniref:hypothetical protein n=1 Tax=Alistipes sp. ZOR0009 TaxID=1339253 RepID=UPI000646911F|nr:hypothetical protein [Alistipes sp. ZOR0009]